MNNRFPLPVVQVVVLLHKVVVRREYWLSASLEMDFADSLPEEPLDMTVEDLIGKQLDSLVAMVEDSAMGPAWSLVESFAARLTVDFAEGLAEASAESFVVAKPAKLAERLIERSEDLPGKFAVEPFEEPAEYLGNTLAGMALEHGADEFVDIQVEKLEVGLVDIEIDILTDQQTSWLDAHLQDQHIPGLMANLAARKSYCLKRCAVVTLENPGDSQRRQVEAFAPRLECCHKDPYIPFVLALRPYHSYQPFPFPYPYLYPCHLLQVLSDRIPWIVFRMSDFRFLIS